MNVSIGMSEWKVMRNVDTYQAWRQKRPLNPGEPMHSGIRETRGSFSTREEAQQFVDNLNAGREG